MDEREKIISIIRPIIKDRFLLYCHEAKDCTNCDTDCKVNLAAKDFADALIAEGIGDVTEWKERAGSEIKSCYKEIAEKRDEIAKLRKQLKRTQNAVKKQKNRAEVAERALDNIMGAFHELLSAIFPDKKIDIDEWKKDILANAEKELAEEKGK